MHSLIIVFILQLVIAFTVAEDDLLNAIQENTDLSQFFTELQRNKIAMNSVELRSLTVFAPTNEAFQHHRNATQVLYHISTTAYTLQNLGKSITTDMTGNPPLFITKRRMNNQDYTWINNALIINSKSNRIFEKPGGGTKQVLHVIDSVLTPITFKSSSSINDIYNLDAHQFLTHSDSINIGEHRVRSFRQRVILLHKERVYQSSGYHTFFIPVEDGFKPHYRPDKIDAKIIDGHVISEKVIFTASAPMEEPQETLAFEDNIKVTISFFKDNGRMFVKSNTIVGDSKHSPGVVLAEIVMANIPVKNGVVHLINRPLMLVDTTVKQFLEDYESGPISAFYAAITDSGEEIMKTVNTLPKVTIFAPINEAWDHPSVKNVIRNKARMAEIFKLHVVSGQYDLDTIKTSVSPTFDKGREMLPHQIATIDFRKNLYFNFLTNKEGNVTVTVEGGGVNSTIVQPNIAQLNGYIHLIDRVLGVPYATVYEKLQSDPMLNDTYYMGTLSQFNLQLNDTTKRYTYFVPSNNAWKETERNYPSAKKKLFMKDFSYHTRLILERHLIVFDRVYTMADLRTLVNETIALPTIRDSLSIRVKEERNTGYTIMWNNKNINVVRPDVECTNGIIHVISSPFLEENDIIVTGGAFSLYYPKLGTILIGNLFMIIFAKLFI